MARFLRLLVVLLASGIVLLSCSTDDTYLPALLEDPMADYEADSIELKTRDTQGYGKGPFWGKYHPPQVISEYQILDQSQTEVIRAEAVAEAESYGWEMEPGVGQTTMVGYKDTNAGPMRLLVAVGSDDPLHPDGAPLVLRISLDFTALPLLEP